MVLHRGQGDPTSYSLSYNPINQPENHGEKQRGTGNNQTDN